MLTILLLGCIVETPLNHLTVARQISDCRYIASYTQVVCHMFVHACMQWLEEDFLGYLQNWKKGVDDRKKVDKMKKKAANKMLLSLETRNGLQMTG